MSKFRAMCWTVDLIDGISWHRCWTNARGLRKRETARSAQAD
jgi:hypothetical protein